ncbi:hypothetical protein DSO57_1017595 [Entomophthora muscae]|uniref:Uncharacterized protein n=1 Tax=Entomophthora muscae TaxID=34485 RepID=A0ACC2RJ87_9FUNG|nr:hypothetical protein DSO57_1017595 [Entomophthora muscae]
MGQDNSKVEVRSHHRKVLPSSVVAPSKESQAAYRKENFKNSYEQSLESSQSTLENSLSLFGTSPTLGSPQLSKLYEIFGGEVGSAEDPGNIEISLSPNLSENPSLLTVLSTSVPSDSFLPEHLKRRPSLPPPSQSLSTPNLAQRHRRTHNRGFQGNSSFDGIVTVVEYLNSSEDPIIAKLKGLPKFPSSFSTGGSQSNSQSSVLGTATFPFPGLWSRSSPAPKPPRLPIATSVSLDDHVKQMAAAYQTHTLTACRLLIRNQLKLVAEVKDAESSCSHIATYTAPHLNHLKESHAQFETTSLREEVGKTRLLLKGVFKSIEKINSFFPQTERIGYLKYQDQSQFPSLHQAYRKAMLKGSAPQFSTRPTGSGILGRRRRESAVVLTLDSVLSERHRPYSTTCGEFYNREIDRPLSSTSRASIEEFGFSASQRLHDIASRPPTSSGYRAYTPSIRNASPSLRHSGCASTYVDKDINTPPMSPIKFSQDLESMLLLPPDINSSSNYPSRSPNDFATFNGLLLRVSTKVSLAKD